MEVIATFDPFLSNFPEVDYVLTFKLDMLNVSMLLLGIGHVAVLEVLILFDNLVWTVRVWSQFILTVILTHI